MFLSAILLCYGSSAYAQNTKPFRVVPDSVFAAFTNTYGKNYSKKVSNLKWDLDQRRYKATFNVKNNSYAITYNPDGTIYKEMWGIKKKDLPDDIYAEAMKHGEILQTWKVYRNNNYNTYEYYIETETMLLFFDTFGQLISGKPTH